MTALVLFGFAGCCLCTVGCLVERVLVRAGVLGVDGSGRR
jgi:hypothetical protein